jgi:hypothetical protein
MRIFKIILLLAGAAGFCAASVFAEGRVMKVLPQFVDAAGRTAVSPSLFDRDAYQFYLNTHPAERETMRFKAQLKTSHLPNGELRMRLELRGVAAGDLPRELKIERVVTGRGWFSTWADIQLDPGQYHELKEVISWRVSLWQGEDYLGSQQSFLWN